MSFHSRLRSKYFIATRQITADATEILYHGSKRNNLTKVNERMKYTGFDFGGIFASYDYDAAASHGDYVYEVHLKEDDILEHIPRTPQVLSILEKETAIRPFDYDDGKKDKKYIQDLDLLWSVVGLEKDIYNNLDNWIDFRDFEEYKKADDDEDRYYISHRIKESIQEKICELLDQKDLAFAGWEAQRIRGAIAKELGYKAVSTKDEHGVSYLILPSVELKRMF